MKFLIDQNLPPQLADWLSDRGFFAAHVRDLGLARSADRDIAEYARREGFVLITKDADFSTCDQLPVVRVRWGNVVNARFFSRFETAFPGLLDALGCGETLIELI